MTGLLGHTLWGRVSWWLLQSPAMTCIPMLVTIVQWEHKRLHRHRSRLPSSQFLCLALLAAFLLIPLFLTCIRCSSSMSHQSSLSFRPPVPVDLSLPRIDVVLPWISLLTPRGVGVCLDLESLSLESMLHAIAVCNLAMLLYSPCMVNLHVKNQASAVDTL
ncbi:hypothetical protein ACQKWADRAFT_143068 [Trichoderma austrokoningii]